MTRMKLKELINLNSFATREDAISYYEYILKNNETLNHTIRAVYIGAVEALKHEWREA